MSEAASPRRYAAFISYRHADNLEPSRRWAEWLHQQLETYEVPKDLVGRTNLRGEPIPASLYPIFRDEEELPAHADLSQNIQRALENSGLLVVLCSPRAVQSRFVAEEIRAFKEMGKSDRILAMILDGEPNASDRADGNTLECLPEPLRFGVVNEKGVLDWNRRTEPIAADVRPEGRAIQGYTSAAAYGDSLEQEDQLPTREIRRLEHEYAERLELAKLKVIAGALAVPLGQLRARDAVHRARRLRRTVAVLGSLTLLALGAAVVAVWQAGRAEQNFQQAEAARRVQQAQLVEASRHAHAAAAREFRAGHWPEGISLLGRALSYHPENRAAAGHLWSALAYGSGNRDEAPLATWSLQTSIESLGVSPDGRWLAAGLDDVAMALVPLEDPRVTGISAVRKVTFPQRIQSRLLRFHPTEPRVIFQGKGLQWWAADWTVDPPRVFKLAGDYHQAAFAPDGKEILARGVLGGVAHLNPASGEMVYSEKPAEQIQLSAFFSPEGKYLGLQRNSRDLEIYDLAGGGPTNVAALEDEGLLIGAQLSPGGKYLMSMSGKGRSIYELASRKQVIVSQPGVGSWPAFAWMPDGSGCVADAADGTVMTYSLPEGVEQLPRLRVGGYPMRAVVSADGQRVMVGNVEGRVSVWPLPRGWTPKPQLFFKGDTESLEWLDPQRVAIQTKDSVEVWDVSAKQRTLTIATGACPGGLEVDPSGRWLASGGPDGLVSFWSLQTGGLLRSGQVAGFGSYRLRASPDGGRLLVSGPDFAGGNITHRFAVLDTATATPLTPGWQVPGVAIQSGIDATRIYYRVRMNDPWQGWSLPGGTVLPALAPEGFDAFATTYARAGQGRLGPTPSLRGETAYSMLEETTGAPASEPLGSGQGRIDWSPDGQRALVKEPDGAVYLFETPLPPPPGPWVRALVEATSGLSLKDSGFGVLLDPVDRQAARAALAEAVPKDPEWGRLIRWLLLDPAERPSAP